MAQRSGRHRAGGLLRLVRTLPLTVVLATSAGALTPLATLDGSPDVTASLDGAVVANEEVARDGFGGALTVVSLGLPPAVAVDAFHAALDGSVLFSLDTAAVVGGTVVSPADVVAWDGATYTKVLDAAAAGVPSGVSTDALTVDGSDLLLSFDVAVTLSGHLFADEDLARWNGATFQPFFDGSAAGLAAALDLDGAHLLTNGHLLLSFDTGGAVGGVTFADEDVLEHDPAAGTWDMAFDASVARSGWGPADLGALAAREPGQIPVSGSLQFDSAVYSAFEIEPFATITVTRAGGTAGTVSVSFTSADGTATAGADYTAVSGTLTWGPGDGAPKTFFVPLLDDTLTEGDETVLLALSDPAGGALLGVPANATLTIVDDETIPGPVTAIPTLDSLALAALALLLAAASFHLLSRRRSPAPSNPKRGE